MPPSKRLRCDDPEWTRRRAAIEGMYVFDRLSQKKIRDKLAEDGFRVTKSEFEAQLRFWDIRKNASKDAWRYIDYRLLNRKQQGKDSAVSYNGRMIAHNTLKKERSRYQPDTLTKFMTTMSPKTPEGMELCIRTPTPAPIQSMWAHTLPWVRFQNKVLPSIVSYLTNRLIDDELLHPGSQAQLDLSPLHRRFNGDSFRSASDFAVNIASMMPEKADNAIANSAQIIVQGATNQAFNEHVQLVLYCLSNNMYEIDYDDEFSWSAVVKLIDSSGLTNQPLHLAQEEDLTVTSIAENLFRLCLEFMHKHASALCASNQNVIIWLLESSQKPDVALDFDIGGEILSPLQIATRTWDFKLANKLLDAGADPNKSSGADCSPLVELLRDGEGAYLEMTPEWRNIFKNLVLRLLEAGASLNEGPSDEGPSALMWAVCVDLEIADILIRHGSKVEYQTQYYMCTKMPGWELVRTHSVMGFSMYRSDEEQAMTKILHLTGHLQRSHSSIPVADLIPADFICLAAYFGFKEVIKYSCVSQNDAATRQNLLFSALCAASLSGCRDTCELLLEYGAPIRSPDRPEAIPSPLHFAALMDHSAVIELLCENRADSNAEFEASRDYHHVTNYMWNRVIGNLRQGYDSRSRYMFDKHPLHINPLGAAIIGADKRTSESFETLIQYGARLPIWAVYYAASMPHSPGIVCSAVEHGSKLNWRGPDGRTPLQRALQPFDMDTRSKPYFDKKDCLAVINSLVDAGAETAGSETELTVLLEHWIHPDELSVRALHDNSRLKANRPSILAAVLLTRSIPRIERALAQYFGTYDPVALCASVMLAISSSETGPLQQLIENRPEAVDIAEQEGIALGLAAWHSRVDILDMLLSKIPSSTPALVRRYTHNPWLPMPLPSKENLQAHISESFEEEFPFWFRKTESEDDFQHVSPLIFSVWSQECLDKLLDNSFKPDKLTVSVAVCHEEVETLGKFLHTKWDDDSNEDQPGPLYWSVMRRLDGMTRLLLNAGLSPNESHQLVPNGRSPLQLAVENGDLDMVQLLLDCGANLVGDGCLQYFKAIRFAEDQAHMVVANFLKNYREWTSFDNGMWELFMTVEECWEALKALDRSSVEELAARLERKRCGPEKTERLDEHSDGDCNRSQQESLDKGMIGPKESACVNESSWAAMATSTDHNSRVAEDHMASQIVDYAAWNRQLDNPENGFQTSWEGRPIDAVHWQLDWNQQPASTSRGFQAAWESMLVGGLDNSTSIEEQLFPPVNVESTWNHQLGATDWNDTQNWLDTEMEGGFCLEIPEGDMDWVETQDPSSW